MKKISKKISKTNLSKKAQSAMEFLMTYGWAILIVLAAITALAYFGVLSPKDFGSQKCIFTTPGFFCTDFSVTSSQITLVLTNSFGTDIKLNNISVESCRNSIDSLMINGQQKRFDLNCSTEQGSFKKSIKLEYTNLATQVDKTLEGEIQGNLK